MTPAAGPQPSPDQVGVTSPVAARIRGALLRAGLGILGAGVLLVVVTVVSVLSAPGPSGFSQAIMILGGMTAVPLLMAGILLLDARHALSRQPFRPGHVRRVRRLLVVLWLLSLVLTVVITYGAAALPDGPVLPPILLSIGSCVLTGIAVLVGRSVLRPAAHGRL